MFFKKTLVFCIIVFAVLQNVLSVFKLTNIVCESHNISWVVINECRLRAIGRDVTVFNMNVTLLHQVNTVDLNVAFLKKANGYKPFLYNFTIDACAFMKKRNNPVFGIVYDMFKNYTNIVHPCPYSTGDLLVQGLYLNQELLKVPLPEGDYLVWLTSYYHSVKAYWIKAYFTFGGN